MRKRFVLGGVVLAALAGWGLTAPASLAPDTVLGDGNAENGALVFAAAGCASCHTAPDAETDGLPVLAGGIRFASDFGTFVAPNISSDPIHGIGAWSDYDLANAIQAGVSPQGAHYYPAFPYTTYAKASPQDIADLVAYLRTLPADATPSQTHEVSFPFNIRRAVGAWKLLYTNENWVLNGDLDPQQARGRYLVEGLAHCAECHTPRTALGGLDTASWMRGAPNPSGDGRIPSIHPDDLDWSAGDIAIYLDTGFTPDYDTVGGEMVDVVENMSKLTEADRGAIAAYLIALP
ncbi:MAG: cytochrome c [Octadecabacter sp.]|nr:cytochrome c [Octadecabacter sp.]